MPSAVTTDSGARITKKISSTRSAEVVATSTVPACSAVTVAPPRRPAAPGRPREPRWPGAAPTPAPPTPARATPAAVAGDGRLPVDGVGVRRGLGPGRDRRQQPLLVVDQVGATLLGQLVLVGHGER